MIRYAIGIDPPKGLAVWDREKKEFYALITTDFWGIIYYLDKMNINTIVYNGDNEFDTIPDIEVFCEAPYLNKPVWIKGSNNRTQNKISQNVGENKHSAKMIVEWCKRNNVKVTECRPTKGSLTKLDKDPFKQLTKCEIRSSEHSRDAAMLVFGR